MGRTVIKTKSGRSINKGIGPVNKKHGSVNTWAVGITVAPREEQYHTKTINSTMRTGWDSPTIFAEPETKISNLHEDLSIIRREEKYGAWKNFYNSLKELVDMNPVADAYVMIQDDVIFCRGVRVFLENVLWPDKNTGFVSVFTPSHYTESPAGFYKRNMGGVLWMAQTIIMPPESARGFLEHPIATGHTGDKNIDNRLGLWASRVSRPPYYFSPSLAQHIGVKSTLWNNNLNQAAGRKSASDFVGEDYDIGHGYE